MNPIFRITALASRLATWVSRRRAMAQAVAGAVAVLLGLWGWTIEEPPSNLAGWFNNVFRTLQLITLQFPKSLEAGIPWQLHVARLLVPVVVALATFHVLVGALTRPVRLALMPHVRGHIVVCGAQLLTEAALNTLAARGRQIVMISEDIDEATRANLEGLGVTVVAADPHQPATFIALNLKEAAAVFLAKADDMANIDLAMLAMEQAKARPAAQPPLALAVLIEREDLARELDATLDGFARSRNVHFHRICPDRDGLRQDLGQVAPALLKADPGERSHILVIGFAGLWWQTLMQLIVSAQDHPDLPPLLTLVLDDTEQKALEVWRAEQTDLSLVAEFIVVARSGGLLPPELALVDWRATWPRPQLAVVQRPDAEAVATVLAMRRPGNAFGLSEQPILVRRTVEDRLLRRIDGPSTEGKTPRTIPFGGLIRAEAIERILDRKGDEAAIALHASYLNLAKTMGDGPTQALAAWDGLPENLRDANRAAAEHRPIMVAAAGGEDATSHLSAEVLERLARIEHRRWIADRIDRGWRSGAVRDDARRLHPSLVPYEALDDTEREKDRAAVRAVLALPAAKVSG